MIIAQFKTAGWVAVLGACSTAHGPSSGNDADIATFDASFATADGQNSQPDAAVVDGAPDEALPEEYQNPDEQQAVFNMVHMVCDRAFECQLNWVTQGYMSAGTFVDLFSSSNQACYDELVLYGNIEYTYAALATGNVEYDPVQGQTCMLSLWQAWHNQSCAEIWTNDGAGGIADPSMKTCFGMYAGTSPTGSLCQYDMECAAEEDACQSGCLDCTGDDCTQVPPFCGTTCPL